jgi:RIO kinase 1
VDSEDTYFDKYEEYAELFDPMLTDRQAHRHRPKARHKAKRTGRQIVTELADDVSGLEGGFDTTYRPSRYEEGWLLSSLRTFYDQGLIKDVLSVVKGGKEASVYRCQADPATGATVLAAKVYRPSQFRNLRNDSMYRQGRAFLDAYGHDHDFARDRRVLKAVKKKTEFGRAVRHTSWLMHEFSALESLYQAGGAVPQPVAAGENAILMSYHGDARMAAPTLNQVALDPDEAGPLLQEVLRNVTLMLQEGLIHGDLSAYNMLYWEGRIIIIDFPQVTDLYANENAYFILERDIRRTCEYFAGQGVACDSENITAELWGRYGYDRTISEEEFDVETTDY